MMTVCEYNKKTKQGHIQKIQPTKKGSPMGPGGGGGTCKPLGK